MSVSLEGVARLVQRESGIVLGPSQLPSLDAAIARVAPDLTADALLDRRVSAETLQRLIDEVTIRETFFFRHRSELDAIDWHALLDRAHARGSQVVRVWVAGCASGEEAYTVAILACEAFACAAPPVRVLASDIAATALEQSVAGRYRERSVQTVQAPIRERYFSSEHGMLRVNERLRALVEFRRHNLVRDPVPPVGERAFDVILCRNVLIYFDHATVERLLQALEGALAPAGLLLLGAADRLSRHALPIPRTQLPSRAEPLSSRARTPIRKVLPRTSRQSATRIHAAPSTPSVDRRTRASTDDPPTPAAAMQAADRGELDRAVRITLDVLTEDPLNSQAHFIRGVAELARDDARAAVEPLRRALYSDPNFGLAAFKLACAYDALNEVGPAQRAYERTLRTLDQQEAEQTTPSDRLDLLDIATACHTRLRDLSSQRA